MGGGGGGGSGVAGLGLCVRKEGRDDAGVWGLSVGLKTDPCH